MTHLILVSVVIGLLARRTSAIAHRSDPTLATNYCPFLTYTVDTGMAAAAGVSNGNEDRIKVVGTKRAPSFEDLVADVESYKTIRQDVLTAYHKADMALKEMKKRKPAVGAVAKAAEAKEKKELTTKLRNAKDDLEKVDSDLKFAAKKLKAAEGNAKKQRVAVNNAKNVKNTKAGRGKQYPEVCLVDAYAADPTDINAFPFLVKKDPRDVELLKQLGANQPWAQAPRVSEAWESIASDMMDMVDGYGLPMFENLTARSLKDRWAKICAGMKGFQQHSLRTGTDDEVYNDFVVNFEQVWEIHQEFLNAESAGRKKDALLATAHKAAALGDKSEHIARIKKEKEVVQSGFGMRETPAALLSSTDDSLAEMMKMRQARNENREKRDKAKGEYELLRLEMEERAQKRAELAEERAQKRAEEAEERAANRDAMMMNMLAMMARSFGGARGAQSISPPPEDGEE
jgi:hypothetical protein